MSDVQRVLRGAFPGPQLEPDATVRAQLVRLGQQAMRYGGADAIAGLALLDEQGRPLRDEQGNQLIEG
jgi:hypothetical protein